jgi:hypothetical protein
MAKDGGENLSIVKTTISKNATVWRYGGIVDGIGDPYFVAMKYLTGKIEKVE